jgi:hypothetical protein
MFRTEVWKNTEKLKEKSPTTVHLKTHCVSVLFIFTFWSPENYFLLFFAVAIGVLFAGYIR